jgi:hypothetical protein
MSGQTNYYKISIRTRLKHLDDRIISLRMEVWAHKISLTPPPFIEMFVPSQESERSCIRVLGVSICSLSMIFLLDLLVEETRVSGENHRPVTSH